MAKTVQGDSVNQYISQMRESLAASNIVDTAQIDKLLQSRGLESVLTNSNLLQYFKIAAAGLNVITTSFPNVGVNGGKSLSAAAPDPADYQFYWSKEHDTHKGVPGLDFIPKNYLSNPEMMAQWVGFTEREYNSYKALMGVQPTGAPSAPGAPGSAPPPGAPPGQQNQGAPSGGGQGGQGGYPGGNSQGGGSTKSLSTGGSNTKSLGAPPPPPGMGGGGGGYPGSDVGYGNYGGGYSGGSGAAGYSHDDFFPQAEWNWAQNNVNGMVGADWLQPLFSTNQRYREVAAYTVDQLNQIDQFQARIMTEFNTLDMTTPEGQRRQFVLMQELQNLGSKKTEVMDKLKQMQTQTDNLTKGLKDLQQKLFDDVNKIIANVR